MTDDSVTPNTVQTPKPAKTITKSDIGKDSAVWAEPVDISGHTKGSTHSNSVGRFFDLGAEDSIHGGTNERENKWHCIFSS